MTQEEIKKVLDDHEIWLKSCGRNGKSANLSGCDLRWANLEKVQGLDVVRCTIHTSRQNNTVTYIPALDIVTTGCFQGTLDELKKKVEITHKDNHRIRERYYRVIRFFEETVKDYEECKKSVL